MTSENKAPECGHPFCGETCGSAAIEAPHTQRELTQIAAARAAMCRRQSALIETLRAELAAEKAKGELALMAAHAIDAALERDGWHYASIAREGLRKVIAAYEVKK